MMQIRIAAKQFDIGETLPEKVRAKLTAAISKYFDRDAEAHVIFGKERTSFRADCSVHLSSGTTMQSHGSGPNAYVAFDLALDHLEKRVRRYRRRFKHHHERGSAQRRFAE